MKILRLGAVAGMALAIAACPQDRDPALDDPAVAPPAEEPMAAPPAAEQANLEAVAGSGVTGEVHVTPRQNQTEVMLMVHNGPPNESLGARVHSGTCESPGPELARLDAVGTDDMGRGHSQTSVGHAPHLILDGNHIAAVYAPGTEPERDLPIACATLPQTGTGMQPGMRHPGQPGAADQPGTTRP
jgi:hypothetical protein